MCAKFHAFIRFPQYLGHPSVPVWSSLCCIVYTDHSEQMLNSCSLESGVGGRKEECQRCPGLQLVGVRVRTESQRLWWRAVIEDDGEAGRDHR